MICLFETNDRGLIEVDTERNLVYFRQQDYEIALRPDGSFEDWNGTHFRFINAKTRDNNIPFLQIMEWRDFSAYLINQNQLPV